MRNCFVDNWRHDINNSPKLEFYSQLKSEFLAEPYLDHIKVSSHRSSVTRLRISAHNLFIERGRYERPLISRELRWCAFCYNQSNNVVVEDEQHALLTCPLVEPIVNKVLGQTDTLRTLADLTTSSESNAKKHNVSIGRLTCAILEAYDAHTNYYKTQDFHNKTGQCILL